MKISNNFLICIGKNLKKEKILHTIVPCSLVIITEAEGCIKEVVAEVASIKMEAIVQISTTNKEEGTIRIKVTIKTAV